MDGIEQMARKNGMGVAELRKIAGDERLEDMDRGIRDGKRRFLIYHVIVSQLGINIRYSLTLEHDEMSIYRSYLINNVSFLFF